MRTALIGGIGNVLLGDDRVGPYIVRLLESRCDFDHRVELADLGTPVLDLTHQIVGLRALILIDSVANDEPSGTVTVYRKQDILRIAPAERLDPHSPALSECLATAEMLGASPEYVVLVGITGASYEPGSALSHRVEAAVEQAIEIVVGELQSLNYSVTKKDSAVATEIWWAKNSSSGSNEPLRPA